MAGVYAGEIEHDDDSEYFVLPSHLDLGIAFGLTGKTSASLNMLTPNIWIVMQINFENGVPRPIGTDAGDEFTNSMVVLTVGGYTMGGVQGQISVSDYKTYFDFMGNESGWSGTVEFSGMFEMVVDEDIPLFPVSGRIVVMPFPAEAD